MPIPNLFDGSLGESSELAERIVYGDIGHAGDSKNADRLARGELRPSTSCDKIRLESGNLVSFETHENPAGKDPP